MKPARRGRALERFVAKLLKDEDLEPRFPFRPRGEEIDGSFVLHHRVFLLEIKWLAGKVPASQIYAFRGKVEGKLDGTVGVFVSLSGFSDDAILAVRFGKSTRVLFWDGDDFRAVVDGRVRFADVMWLKLRRASETGQPYLPIASIESVEMA